MLDISDGKVRGGFRVNFGKAGMMVGIYFSVFFTANFADRLPAASGRAADMAVADDRAVVRNVEAAVNGSFDGEGDPGGNGEAGTIGKCQRRAGGYGRVAGERVVPDDGSRRLVNQDAVLDMVLKVLVSRGVDPGIGDVSGTG